MKKLLIVVVAACASALAFYAPVREKAIAALPASITSVFEPADPLPKDLVLSLTDNYDLSWGLNDLHGNRLGLSDLRGKIAMVLVWNSECGKQCIDTMHHMERLAKKYAQQDVVAVTFNNDMLTKGMDDPQVKQYVADNDIKLPVLLMDLPTGQTFWPTECKYGLSKQPFHEVIVLDRNGAVRFRANQDYLRPVVQQLLTANWSEYSDERVKAGTYPPVKTD